jgi:hypothetical protein
MKGFTIRNTHVKYESPNTNQKLWPWLKILKSRSNSKVNGQRVKVMVSIERSCRKEYTCEIWKPYHLPIKSYEQGLSFWKIGQTPRSKVRGTRSWYQMKDLMKALPLTNLKLWARLKFLKSRLNSKVKGQRIKVMVSNERPYHKEYTCEIWRPYHLPIKSYDQV